MKLHYFIFLLLSLLVQGCFSIGSTTLPTASEGFIPKKDYPISFDRAWTVVDNVLRNERISVAQYDKRNKKITTEYIQGSQSVQIISVINSRYKYNISFTNSSPNQTAIQIVAHIETSSKNMDWHEVSRDNPEIIEELEYWLYEKIESELTKEVQ